MDPSPFESDQDSVNITIPHSKEPLIEEPPPISIQMFQQQQPAHQSASSFNTCHEVQASAGSQVLKKNEIDEEDEEGDDKLYSSKYDHSRLPSSEVSQQPIMDKEEVKCREFLRSLQRPHGKDYEQQVMQFKSQQRGNRSADKMRQDPRPANLPHIEERLKQIYQLKTMREEALMMLTQMSSRRARSSQPVRPVVEQPPHPVPPLKQLKEITKPTRGPLSRRSDSEGVSARLLMPTKSSRLKTLPTLKEKPADPKPKWANTLSLRKNLATTSRSSRQQSPIKPAPTGPKPRLSKNPHFQTPLKRSIVAPLTERKLKKPEWNDRQEAPAKSFAEMKPRTLPKAPSFAQIKTKSIQVKTTLKMQENKAQTLRQKKKLDQNPRSDTKKSLFNSALKPVSWRKQPMTPSSSAGPNMFQNSLRQSQPAVWHPLKRGFHQRRRKAKSCPRKVPTMMGRARTSRSKSLPLPELGPIPEDLTKSKLKPPSKILFKKPQFVNRESSKPARPVKLVMPKETPTLKQTPRYSLRTPSKQITSPRQATTPKHNFRPALKHAVGSTPKHNFRPSLLQPPLQPSQPPRQQRQHQALEESKDDSKKLRHSRTSSVNFLELNKNMARYKVKPVSQQRSISRKAHETPKFKLKPQPVVKATPPPPKPKAELVDAGVVVSIDLSVKLDESRIEMWNPDASIVTSKGTSQSQKILKTIKQRAVIGLLIEFLGENLVARPGISVFKLAASSKGLWTSIVSKVKPQDMKQSFFKSRAIETLLAKPNLTGFKGHDDTYKVMKKACKHFVFGGSIFESVRFLNKDQVEEKPNRLMKQILRTSVPGELLLLLSLELGGGLKADVVLLSFSPAKVGGEHYSDVAKKLTGFGRVVLFKNKEEGGPQIIELIEGQFNQGKLSGYGRSINALKATCSVGYWKPELLPGDAQAADEQETTIRNTIRGRPFGKWVEFNLKGEEVSKSGIYAGYGFCTKPGPIAEFEQNSEPAIERTGFIQAFLRQLR